MFTTFSPGKKKKKHSNSFRSFSITHQLSVYFWALPFHIPSPNRVYVTPSSARKGSLEAAMSKLRIGVLPTSRPQAISLGRAGGMKSWVALRFLLWKNLMGKKNNILLMEEIPKNHLWCIRIIKPLPTSTGAGFCPSTVGAVVKLIRRLTRLVHLKKMFPRKVEKEKHLQNQFVGSSR